MREEANTGFTILIFSNIHQVMHAEKIIADKGYPYRIVPVPSSLSSECGLCIRIESSYLDSILSDLQNIKVEIHTLNNEP
ncbi:MAG TPA: DUF3343 domain-containing protein [Tenuifilaceae bacterium]|jgi:hypothetical protein|nr:DUF3343 domain-containing protein [Bacteroidales bacterium]HOG71360.1 DUF3343 domain-containing protein [Tenuifilaceae bacterium]HOW20160.1 DUF3343 domain-containing protein [Tenuifilaceae bacterium]HQQ28896.1 DUF3343 domain-containing protein [Tenuifilaceae bacterium]